MISINEFINVFKESFDELKSEVKPSSKYKELEEWTSMQALILTAHIDDTLHIVLSTDDYKETSTIQELYQKIVSKL